MVAAGRNRVNGVVDEARVLSGNFMAHAEMNAFAALDRFKADGLQLYTTLQPCLMCAATSVFMHTHTVHFASTDEFFEGLGDLWSHHPYSDRNKPIELGPLDGLPAVFARLLPLSVQAAEQPDGSVIRKARQTIPDLADLATAPEVIDALDELRMQRGSAADAMARISLVCHV